VLPAAHLAAPVPWLSTAAQVCRHQAAFCAKGRACRASGRPCDCGVRPRSGALQAPRPVSIFAALGPGILLPCTASARFGRIVSPPPGGPCAPRPARVRFRRRLPRARHHCARGSLRPLAPRAPQPAHRFIGLHSERAPARPHNTPLRTDPSTRSRALLSLRADTTNKSSLP
jgi:hypothetical protein